MAGTPFTTTAVTFPGQALPRDKAWSPTTRNGQFWLGKAGNMIQLPSTDPAYAVVVTRGDVLHGLIGAGSTVTHRAHQKRAWTITWKRIQRRDFEIVNGFYRGIFGDGPFCLIDPADVNLLGLDTSMCGARNGKIGSWTTGGADTIAYDSTITPPITPCGVLRWHGAGNGSILAAGPRSGASVIFDATSSIPLVQALQQELSVYAWTASGVANVQLVLNDGVSATAASSTVGLTTTPQQLALNHAAGAFGANGYLILTVKCLTASAPDILISAPQLEFGVSTPSAFAAGSDAPRVVIPPLTRAVDRVWGKPMSLTLAQI